MKTKNTLLILVMTSLVIVSLLVVGCAKPAAGPTATERETINLTIASGHPASATTWVGTVESFFCPEVAKRVHERTYYDIEWNMQWAGTVSKLGETLEAVETGLADMGAVVTAFEPSKLLLSQYCYYTPFGPSDPLLAARASIKLYDDIPEMSAIFEDDYNQSWIASAGFTGCYNLITTFPVDKVSDLEGKKIAAAGPNIPWVTAAGAVGVQSNLTEAYTSFQTGVYEGWVMFAQSDVSFKLYEVAPYVTEVGFGCVDVCTITCNMDIWEGLPKEVQDIMLEVGREYMMVEAQDVVDQTNAANEVMRNASGVTISAFSDAQRQAWAAMLPNIPNEKAQEANAAGLPGTETMKRWLEILEEEGYTCPREWQID